MNAVGQTVALLFLLWSVLVDGQSKPDNKPVVVRMSGQTREATTPQPISPLATRVVVVHNNMVPVPIECFAPPSSGACSKDMVRVYYDSDTRTCKPFSYTGCGGNANRFYSVKNCYRICHPYRYKIKPVVAKVVRHQPPTTVKPAAPPVPVVPQPMSKPAPPPPSKPQPTPAYTPSNNDAKCPDGRRSVNGRCGGSLHMRKKRHRHRRRSGLGPNSKHHHTHRHKNRKDLFRDRGLQREALFSNEIMSDYNDEYMRGPLPPPLPPPPRPSRPIPPRLIPRGPPIFREMRGQHRLPPFRPGSRQTFFRRPSRFRRRAPFYNRYI